MSYKLGDIYQNIHTKEYFGIVFISKCPKYEPLNSEQLPSGGTVLTLTDGINWSEF